MGLLNLASSLYCATVLHPEPFCSAADPRAAGTALYVSARPRNAIPALPVEVFSLLLAHLPSAEHMRSVPQTALQVNLQRPNEESRSNPHLRMGLQLCPSAFIKERRMKERNGASFLLTFPIVCVLAVPWEWHLVIEL